MRLAKVAAIVLAAGRATRFGAAQDDASKLVAALEGRPLVAHAVAGALASRAAPVIVITGHEAGQVGAALAGMEVVLVHNARFADGMAGSVAAGIAAVPAGAEAAMVLLGDMPRVAPSTLDALIDAFECARPDAAVPTYLGSRGNPVLIARSLFPALCMLRGDEGARRILASGDAVVLPVPVDDPGVLADVDTREALAALAGKA